MESPSTPQAPLPSVALQLLPCPLPGGAGMSRVQGHLGTPLSQALGQGNEAKLLPQRRGRKPASGDVPRTPSRAGFSLGLS